MIKDNISISIGGEDFEDLRKQNCYYVDKTDAIYRLVGEHNNNVTLFTRPRRFGKTLFMSTLECFFDISKDSRDLFDNLLISERKEFCEEWMNKYPVVSISF